MKNERQEGKDQTKADDDDEELCLKLCRVSQEEGFNITIRKRRFLLSPVNVIAITLHAPVSASAVSDGGRQWRKQADIYRKH